MQIFISEEYKISSTVFVWNEMKNSLRANSTYLYRKLLSCRNHRLVLSVDLCVSLSRKELNHLTSLWSGQVIFAQCCLYQELLRHHEDHWRSIFLYNISGLTRFNVYGPWNLAYHKWSKSGGKILHTVQN